MKRMAMILSIILLIALTSCNKAEKKLGFNPLYQPSPGDQRFFDDDGNIIHVISRDGYETWYEYHPNGMPSMTFFTAAQT